MIIHGTLLQMHPIHVHTRKDACAVIIRLSSDQAHGIPGAPGSSALSVTDLRASVTGAVRSTRRKTRHQRQALVESHDQSQRTRGSKRNDCFLVATLIRRSQSGGWCVPRTRGGNGDRMSRGRRDSCRRREAVWTSTSTPSLPTRAKTSPPLARGLPVCFWEVNAAATTEARGGQRLQVEPASRLPTWSLASKPVRLGSTM